MKKYILRITPILFLLIGCATTGPGGKKSVIFIPTSQEVAIGAGMARHVDSTEKILDDQVWQDYINEVGQRIVAVSDRKDIEYHFTVIDSDQINAFAAPGGFIYFYTGLIREMDDEAEFASVLAHEIAHVVGRHGIRRLQNALGVAAAAELVLGDSASALISTAVGLGMGLIFADYSRDNEREADAFGMHYMVKAGYNPNSMISMFNILAEKGTHEPNVFEKMASSHPETKERIDNAFRQLEELKPLPDGLVLRQARFKQMLERLPKR